jgi:hypothetical protein
MSIEQAAAKLGKVITAWDLAIANVTKPDKPKPSAKAKPKPCVVCGETFTPQLNHPNALYCSSHCKGVVQARREKAARHAAGLKQRGGKQECKVNMKRTWKQVFGKPVAIDDQLWC